MFNPCRASHTPSFPIEDRVRAFAIVLQEEFGTRFSFYRGDTGEPIATDDQRPPMPLSARTLGTLEQEPVLVRTVGADRSLYRVILCLNNGVPAIIAVGELAALAADRDLERGRIEKWARSFRQRLTAPGNSGSLERPLAGDAVPASQTQACWRTLLSFKDVVRRLRVHRAPAAGIQHLLEAAAAALGTETVLWLPHGSEEVLTHGDSGLSVVECRQLQGVLAGSMEAQRTGVLVSNAVEELSWGSRFPGVRNLIALLAADAQPAGWLLALNKRQTAEDAEAGFQRSDAALLTPFASLLGFFLRSAARYRDLKDLLVGVTRSLTAAIDAKDAYTYGHSERVARIAVELAREMALPADELSDVYLAGLLHDIGKIGIRDAVLAKKEPLTPEDLAHIREHVLIGYRILADLTPIRHLLSGVLYHHERYDGTGYPEGRAGEAIPQLARIIAVADGYDAMTTSRPYRDALPPERAEAALIEGAGTQWDRQVIDAFLRCRAQVRTIRQRGIGESLRHALDGALRVGGAAPDLSVGISG